MIKVMKFGGTSVKDADRIANVCKIVIDASKKNDIYLVCSAMKGVTDDLISCGNLAEKRDNKYKKIIENIKLRQKDAVEKLIKDKSLQDEILNSLYMMIKEVEEILVGVFLVKSFSVRSVDLISGLGERLNNFLIATYLKSLGVDATYIDSREIIKTDDNFGNANVNFKVTEKLAKDKLLNIKGIKVITGFIASTTDNITTTLGRNGSDYTASIIANCVEAEVIEIWTDVDGVLSADPKVVPDAKVLPEITILEAMELSYFGANVIHPSTMQPALEKGIPILIKNSFNPTAKGTKISEKCKPHKNLITGIATSNNIAMINLEGSGMIGRAGFAAEVFTILAEANVNIIMISQCSSEHSICFACKESDATKAKKVLIKNFKKDLFNGVLNKINVLIDVCSLSVIGENMIGKFGIAGKLFNALGEKKINVLAIAQGSSERNISIIIDTKNRDLALKTIHKAFIY